jgi:hypothetical protein
MRTMDDEEQRHRRWRRAVRFERLRKNFDLVPFADMADWCARKPGSLDRDEAAHPQAYRDLEKSVTDGEFGPPEKPHVAYLPNPPHGDHPGRFPLRLPAYQIVDLKRVADLWTSRALCARWFTSRGYDMPSWLVATPPREVKPRGLFRRRAAATANNQTALPARKNRGGRPPAADWEAIGRLFELKVDDLGPPQADNVKGWRTQADVERWVGEQLVSRDENATSSTVRKHVRVMLGRLGENRAET